MIIGRDPKYRIEVRIRKRMRGKSGIALGDDKTFSLYYTTVPEVYRVIMRALKKAFRK